MAGLGMFITEVHLYRDSNYLEGEYKLSMAWYAERKGKCWYCICGVEMM